MLTEGLVLCLEPAVVTDMAEDLARVPAFRTWLMDLLHPALLPFVVQSWNTQEAGSANVPRFAPEGGAAFFQPFGWALHACISAWEEGERLNRPVGLPRTALSDNKLEAFRMMNTYVRLDRADS